MPITGTFLADFSQFVSEVNTAVVALDGLTSDADKAQAALTEVAGVDPAGLQATAAAAKDLGAAVADVPAGLTATATAAKSVSTETDTMSAALDQARTVAAALGIGLSVGAVVAFGREMMDVSGQIQKMADTTGLSIGEVQGLMAAAEQTSTPIAVFQTAIATLQQKIGSHDAGLVAAAHALGLSFEELARASPWQAMRTYADALTEVKDQNERAALGNDTFGKSWRELGASVKEGALTVAEEAPKMSEKAVAGWNAIDGAIKGATRSLKVFVGEMAGEAVTTGGGNAFGGDHASDLQEIADAASNAAVELVAVGHAASSVVEPFRDVITGSIDLRAEQRGLAAEVAANNAAVAEAERQQRAWAAALTELDTAGAGWYQTLLGIDGEVVEAIRYYLQAGVQQGVLATAYGLTATQVRAVADGIKAETGANEAALAIGTKVLEAHAAEVKALQDDVNARDAAILKTKEADATNQAYYIRIADQARVAYQIAAQAGSGYTDARIEQLRRESEAADTTLQNWQQAAERAMSGASNAVDATTEQLRQLNAELANVPNVATIRGEVAPGYVSPFGPVAGMGGRLPAGAGGSVSAADADAYRPASYGALGNVFIQPPTSLVGRFRTEAPVVNVQSGAVTMNYPIMNDPAALQQLGETVGRAILSNVTRTGTPV